MPKLTPAMARYLESRRHVGVHLSDRELERAQDEIVWEDASREGLVMVTKDEDFSHLANRPS